MQGTRRVSSLTAVVLLTGLLSAPSSSFAQAQRSAQRSIIERLMQRGRVVNMVDDFLEFWDQARTQPLKRQRWLFRREIETKYRDYFERAIYRSADARHRRAMLDEFLVRVPERVASMREFSKMMADPTVSPLVDVLVNFKIWFREFRSNADVYIGLSLFSFDGAIRPVGNDRGIPDTLCLGAEVLLRYSREQLRIAVAHEMFHLYHFSFLFEHPQVGEFQAAHMPLMIEGLAVAATEAVFPNSTEELYLHFTAEQLADQRQHLQTSAAQFLQLIISGAPPDYYQQWFTNNSTQASPRAGYLLGRQVARRLLAFYTFDQLVRMTPAELRGHAEQELADIAGVHVMLAATSESARDN